MLSKEELTIGAILGLGFFWAIGWWCLLLAIITSILWAMGGAGIWGTKAWRRVLIPIVIFIAIGHYNLACVIAGFSTWGLLSVGYGSRDNNV